MEKFPGFAGYKARIMDYSEYVDKLIQMSDDIDSYIQWSETPQGHDYWEKVRENLESLASYKVDEDMQITFNGKNYKLVEVK